MKHGIKQIVALLLVSVMIIHGTSNAVASVMDSMDQQTTEETTLLEEAETSDTEEVVSEEPGEEDISEKTDGGEESEISDEEKSEETENSVNEEDISEEDSQSFSLEKNETGINALALEDEEQSTGSDIIRATPQDYNMSSFITAVSIKAQIDGNWYEVPTGLPEGTTVPKDAPVQVKISYDPSIKGISFIAGDTISYQLPYNIIPYENQEGNVVDGASVVGNYVISTDGKIMITLTNEAYLKASNGVLKNGSISFEGHFNSTSWGDGENTRIDFGNVTIEVPIEEDQVVEKGVVNIDKSDPDDKVMYDETRKCYYIRYQIVVSTPSDNTKVMEDIKVKDIFTTGSDYIDTTQIWDVNIDGKGDTGAFNTSSLIWTIGNMNKGETHTLAFCVKVKDSIVADGTDSKRTIVNKGEVYSGADKLNEDTATTNANSGLNIVKSLPNDPAYNPTDGTITYQVTVSAPANNTWTINNITVEDVFGECKEYVERYVSASSTDDSDTIQSDATNKKLDWTIGPLAPGEEVTLTYTVKIDPKIFVDETGTTTSPAVINRVLRNRATLKVKGEEVGKSNASVTFQKTWLRKSGEQQDDGRIKFTVTANESTSQMPSLSGNFTFSDRLSGPWVYDGVVEITRSDGKKFSLNVDGKTSWTWEDTESSNDMGYSYTFVYYARTDGQVIGTPSISNTAGIGIGYGGSTYDHEASWSGTGQSFDALKKQFDSRNDNIATWTSKIVCNVPAGTVYYDWYQQREGQNEWSIRDDQLASIQIGGAGAGKNYTVERYTEDNKTGFKITFNEAINASEENPITITYQTLLNTDDVTAGTAGRYVNRAKLVINGNEDSARAECSYIKEQRIDKTAGTYDASTGLMTWNIKVNTTGTLAGDAVVTDELPDGLQYVSAEITERGSKATDTTMTPEVNGQNVTMNLGGLVESNDLDAYVTITLTTKVVDEEFLVNNKEKTYENKAVLNYKGETSESTAQQTINNVSLTKEGIYDKNTAPDIVYTIGINPNGLDMLKNADTIKITDTMGEGLMLKTDTLVIKNTKTGENVPIQNLVVEGNVFSFDVPDDQPLEVTYHAYIAGEVGAKIEAINTVSYSGTAMTEEVGEKNEIIVSESKATIESMPGFFILKKDGTTMENLAGATYRLYEVTEAGEIGSEAGVGTSDALGTVTFAGLDADKVYAFKETVAPEGYYIDETNKEYTYVAFKESAITEGMAKLNVNIIQKGIFFERYNYKGEIEVTKNFYGTAEDGSYYFGLFDADGNLVTLNGEPAVKDVRVYNGKVTEKAVFRGVPFGTYSVYETDSNGVKLTKRSDGTVVTNGLKYIVEGEGAVTVSEDDPKGNITITNTYVPLEVTLKATKALKNKDASSLKTFSFNLKGEDVDDTKENTENGSITFDKLTFTKDDVGTHTYSVKEIVPEGVTAVQPQKDGITYDLTEYTVEITVSHSNTDGLSVVVKVNGTEITGTNGVYELPQQTKEGETASFVNIYDVGTSIQFEGTKTLSGASLSKDAFSFEITGPNLKDENGNPVNTLTVGHEADGTIRYPEIFYTLADLEGDTSRDFEYKIKEMHAGETIDGITYSAAEYTVVVTVTNTGTSLSARAATGYSLTSKNFVNSYHAEATTDISGVKTLNGAQLQAGVYRFRLEETTEDAEDPYVTSVTNDANGEFTFQFPTYTQADDGKIFTYEITEVNEGKDGISYDSTVYVVTVKVTDNRDGTLTLSKSIRVKNGETEVGNITFTNGFNGSVELTKTNGKSGADYQVLSGAVFRLYKVTSDPASPDTVGDYTTDANGKISVNNLVEGTYYFVEVTPPAGYKIVTDENGAPVHYIFNIGPNGGNAVVHANITAGNEQKLGTLKLEKKDADGDKSLQGAEFTLYKDGEEYQTGLTTDADGIISVQSLPWGDYYFVETKPADGYVLDNTPTETVTINAAYVDGEIQTVEKNNDSTKFEFAKIDAETGELVEGAELELRDSNGELIEAWTSEKNSHKIEAVLIVGETYTLQEVTPPDGYAFAEPVTFTVENKSEWITIKMEDKPTDVSITKTDITDDKELPGAELEVRDKETNELIDSWTSTDEAHEIVGKLIVGKTYILKETVAPTGYSYITTDIEFTINNDGTITTEAPTTTDEDGNPTGILAQDSRLWFCVDKISVTSQSEVKGAELTVYDKETGKEITKWVSDGEAAHNFGEYLTAGKDYILRETIAPDGYTYISDTEFRVNRDGTIETLLNKTIDLNGNDIYLVEDDLTRIIVEKVDEDGNPVKKARMAIVDAETGELIREWITDGEEKEITGKLIAGRTYRLVELEAPKGFVIAQDIEFTVPKEAETVEIRMVDLEDNGKNVGKTVSVKTGDTAGTGRYIFLMAAAVLCMVFTGVRKKSKQ